MIRLTIPILANLLFLAGALVAVPSAEVERSQEASPIRVYVFTTPPKSGFVDADSKGREDSVGDIKKALQGKKKALALVDQRDDAEVVIEVTRRGWELADGKFIGANPITGNDVEQSGNVRATLSVGEYTTELVGRGGHYTGLWKIAARSIADEIDKWIKDNRASIPRKS